MNKQIVFTKKDTAELLDFDERPVGDDEVKVRTYISTISCGTERANITGNSFVTIYSAPEEAPVFPRYTGYSSSGVVVETGKNVKNISVGDRVAMTGSLHKNYNVLASKNVIKIEDDSVSFEEAALCYIGTFPMAAIRKTRLEIGESTLVMGLGILGLLAVEFAHAAGAVPVIAADPVKERRELALKFGADFALGPFEKNFAEKVKELTSGGANTAIEVTGQGAGLNECLDCMARFGRVALLGCTRESDFSVDYYRKVHGPGISLIGAHTMARPDHESRPGAFTSRDDVKAILKLAANKRINLKDIIAETHSPDECTQVYTRLINDRKFPVVVQYDWRML